MKNKPYTVTTMNLESSAGDAEIGRLMLEALRAYNDDREEDALLLVRQIQEIRSKCPDCKL